MTGMRRALVVGLLMLFVGCGDEASDERAVAVSTPARSTPAVSVGAITASVALASLRPNGACGVPRLRRHERAVHAVTDVMGIFRRRQHSADAVATAEVQGLPAGDIDFDATRAPTGIGGRMVLVPTHTVKETCEADPPQQGPPGVCVIRSGAPQIASRCFDIRAITAGRAAALSDSDQVVGLVPDGIDRVIIEVAGARTETSVVENAYRARLPRSDGGQARITLVKDPLDGCQPSVAMRAAAPTLDHPPDPGGVPEIVRRSVRTDMDSRIAAKFARIWGGGDEITYWIVPHLRCEVASLTADTVCVTPVKDTYTKAASACAEPGQTGWIHFPDGDVSAIAGFAPADAREAIVHVEGGTVVLPVKERAYAGRLEGIPLEGEVRRARVEFR